jgi:putative FmdB family regulatory protein
MPLYEYFCPPCNEQFEILRPVSQMDHPATCPSGHTTNNRVLSIFAPVSKSTANVATRMPMMGGGADACCSTDMGGHGGCSCC